jgi:hypothetical protein
MMHIDVDHLQVSGEPAAHPKALEALAMGGRV